jgi:PHP domain protein
LTDHDTTDGWHQAAQAIEGTGLKLLRGMEISCSYQGITLHLLSYLHDPDNVALNRELRRSHEARHERARLMIEKLSKDYPITWEEVVAQAAPGATLGRPHIADALVAAGAFKDRSEVFAGPLKPGSPYTVERYAPDPVKACALVRAAGGVPVVAHPRAASRSKRLIPDEVFARMAEVGLAGLEVYHRDHDDAARAQALRLAKDLGLGISGSSDYHGAGKPNRLGENLMPVEFYERVVEQGLLPILEG